MPGRRLGYSVMRRTARLDPERDAEEFMRLSAGVLYGDAMAVHAGFLMGFARQMGVPSIARVVHRGGRGEMMRDCPRRNDDTLTLLGEMVRSGYSSPAGRAAIARMEHIHSRFPITDEQKRYTLATLIFEGERAAQRFHLRVPEPERQARWHFWRGVGEQMPLTGLPATADECLDWMLEYEREHWAYTEAGQAVAEAMLADWQTRWFPPPARSVGRQILLALMDDQLRNVLRLGAPSRQVERLVGLALRAYVVGALVRPVRVERSWVDYFGRRSGMNVSTSPDAGRSSFVSKRAG